METADILNSIKRSVRVIRQWRTASLLVCAGLLFAPTAWSALALSTLDDLSVAEQYQQLNLILMVSEGIDAGFLDAVMPQTNESTSAQPEAMPRFDIDEFQTPLNRIVDQQQQLRRAAQLFRFAVHHRVEILSTLEELAATDPAAVAEVDLIQLAEDAIIVRSALAGTIEYQAKDGDEVMARTLVTYQNSTAYLRNVMEYWKFDQELVAITADAMQDTGGRMEAYQRMLEAEPNLLGFKQHLQSVEEIYKNTAERKVKASDLASKELIDQESQVQQPDRSAAD